MYAPTKTAYLWAVGANLRVRPGLTLKTQNPPDKTDWDNLFFGYALGRILVL